MLKNPAKDQLKDKLKQLIHVYETKKVKLEVDLQACIDEMDFLGAHHLSNQLGYVKKKLRIFYNLENPYYDEIESCESEIEMYKEIIRLRETPENDYPDGFYQSIIHELPKLEQRLNEIKQQSWESAEHATLDESTHFQDAINQLINDQIQKIELTLKAKANLYLYISKSSDQSIQVSFPPISQIEKWYGKILNRHFELKEIGFRDIGGSLGLCIQEANEDLTIEKVIEICARIIYEFRYSYDLDDPILIRYQESTDDPASTDSA